jgi:hypothetical protein
MTKEFAERYFIWLTSQVNLGTNVNSYEGLFRRFHSRAFYWEVPNDDNRIGDALELRREFWGPGNLIPRDGVSIFEVIIALSRRLAFQAGGDQELWAWQLFQNLGLGRMFDPLTLRNERKIDDTIETLMFRTYGPDGKGGFFPLSHPKEDQAKIEIWYQMSAYINERSTE